MIVALAGGVGGARLSDGLSMATPPGELAVIVNVADDFDLWGLRICPDLDTVLYNLAGIASMEQGWGIADDTFQTLSGIAGYGEDPWFQVGDRDIATHILRTEQLARGERLTTIMAGFAAELGVAASILPVSDQRIQTVVTIPSGDVAFQDYFVRRRHQDQVLALRFAGIETATLTDEAGTSIRTADLIVICPSNPFLSIEPILAVEGLRQMIASIPAPKIGVSPIVGGRAIKGPADQIMHSFGKEVSAAAVAEMYLDVLDGFVIDTQDQSEASRIESMGMAVLVTETVMKTRQDRLSLAQEIVAFGSQLQPAGPAA